MSNWLACAVCLYPAYWLGVFVVQALPALARSVILQQRLSFLAVGAWGAMAATQGMRGMSGALWSSVPIAIVAALVFSLMARRHRTLAGLLAFATGAAGIWRYSNWSRYSAGIPMAAWIALALFALLLLAGLRWLAARPR